MIVFIALSILTVTAILYGGLLYQLVQDRIPHPLLSPEDRTAVLALMHIHNVSCFHCGHNEVQYANEDSFTCVCPRGRGRNRHAFV